MLLKYKHAGHLAEEIEMIITHQLMSKVDKNLYLNKAVIVNLNKRSATYNLECN